MKERIRPIITQPYISIRQAMELINKAPHQDPPAPGGILLIVDEGNKLIGVITDGDIRRAILAGVNLAEPIEGIIKRNPVKILDNIAPNEMLFAVTNELRERKSRLAKLENIVIINERNEPEDVVSFFEMWKRSEVKTRTIGIVGLGYVGLTLALTFADSGFKVIGVDTNQSIIDKIINGETHFYEKGLDGMLRKHLNNNFIVKSHFEPGDSDVYVICVGTPLDYDKNVIFSDLETAVREVAKILKTDDLVVLRSTVGIGTCRDFIIPIFEGETSLKVGKDFFLSFAPERTVEGKALEEIKTLPQIIGGYDNVSADLTANLFGAIVSHIIVVSSLEAAESVKLLNNTYRDLMISHANETAQILDGFGLNTYEVIRAANEGYSRSNILVPSPGVGGYCLPKDPYIFLHSAKKINHKSKLSLVSRHINDSMIVFVTNKVFEFMDKYKFGKMNPKIFIMGIAFKGQPETSDTRNSTARQIIEILQERYDNIHVFDPTVDPEIIKGFKYIPTTIEDGFKDADCIMILNNHQSFKEISVYPLLDKTSKPVMFFDGWGMFVDHNLHSLENVYYDGLGVGRKKI